MKIYKNIFELADNYSVFFVDVYGVLFDGTALYDQALSTLKQLREMGKKIIIISNTTQIAESAKSGYMQRGMLQSVHYDEFITSGEFLHQMIVNNHDKLSQLVQNEAKTIKCLFMGNNNIFADSNIKKVDNYIDADLLYIGVPRSSYGAVRIDDVFDDDNNVVKIENILDHDWDKLHDSLGRAGLKEFKHLLGICLSKNKTLLVANPDIFAHNASENGQRISVVTQGCIGRYYQRLGGKTVYVGKPYKDIFEYAKQFTTPTDKIAMIGDTPWTDIVGANNISIDSIMVTTGISQDFLKNMDPNKTVEEKFDILFDYISPKISGFDNCRPKYIIKKM